MSEAQSAKKNACSWALTSSRIIESKTPLIHIIVSTAVPPPPALHPDLRLHVVCFEHSESRMSQCNAIELTSSPAATTRAPMVSPPSADLPAAATVDAEGVSMLSGTSTEYLEEFEMASQMMNLALDLREQYHRMTLLKRPRRLLTPVRPTTSTEGYF